MKFIPILYSTDMVKALLAGRKTMTRRIVKGITIREDGNVNYNFKGGSGNNCEPESLNDFFLGVLDYCPYGNLGDVMWVREGFGVIRYDASTKQATDFVYKADVPKIVTAPWKPSIHMPKIACRLFLKIKSIRVERLQDISENDILSEGVQYPVSKTSDPNKVKPVFKIGNENNAFDFMPNGWEHFSEDKKNYHLLFAHWAELWCNINGRKSWDNNPFVWVIEFEQIDKPENFI